MGASRDLDFISQSITEPEASVPSGFLLLRVTTRDGQHLTGIRINEDTFSIQFRDLTGKVHSFWKSDLAELIKQTGKSPMPSYRTTLTTSELNDLLSYLVSLGGAK